MCVGTPLEQFGHREGNNYLMKGDEVGGKTKAAKF